MKQCGNPKCDVQFEPKSHVHRFCCQKCNAAVRRSNNWGWLRKMAMRRDNSACVECEATDCRLECHHRTPICKGGTNELGNLEMRCVPCHRRIHRSYGEWRVVNERQEQEQEGHIRSDRAA
jgi:hypothetical protein